MSGECVISLVLSRHSKILKQEMDQSYSYLLQLSFIWPAKENTFASCEGALTQKMRRKAPGSILASLFILFIYFLLLPLNLPCVNWAS